MRTSSKLIIAAVLIFIAGWAAFAVMSRQAPKQEPPPPIVSPLHEVIGHSVEGRTIDAYTYVPTGAATTTDLARVLFVGGMHGGYEWNSVLLAYNYMDHLAAHPESVPAGLAVTVIPDLNPDGVYKVIGKEGRFTLADVPDKTPEQEAPGRFNSNGVDLNRNFACNWAPTSTWKGKEVSAGAAAFSEPEAQALRDFVLKDKPVGVVFWHSQAGTVYASECHDGVLPVTADIMNAYARAAGYPAVKSFDAYPITGDSEGWLASIGIPALTVELSSHDTVQWDKNLAGIKAMLSYYETKTSATAK